MGQKTFEQAAGFLRIGAGKEPLDQSGVHPERYALVHQMASDLKTTTQALIGNQALVNKINLTSYVSDAVGMPTLLDIREELAKPGRDPRDAFVAQSFREGVTEPKHLRVGMDFSGVVTNVTAFGAFVDVGVHQDGLVHISALSQTFVKDPRAVVKVGQVLHVWVHSVDLVRKRIALSALGPLKESASLEGGRQTEAPSRQAGGQRQAARRPHPNQGGQGFGPEAPGAALRHNPFASLRLP